MLSHSVPTTTFLGSFYHYFADNEAEKLCKECSDFYKQIIQTQSGFPKSLSNTGFLNCMTPLLL